MRTTNTIYPKRKLTLIKTVYEIAKIVVRYSGKVGRITSGESTILKKFPPGYRPYVKDVLTGTATAFHGGLISDIIKDYMLADDSPGNGIQTPFSKSPSPSKSNQTRGRQTVRRKSGFRKCYQPRSRY